MINVIRIGHMRDHLSFFQTICRTSSCLHHFLPPHRDTSVISRLLCSPLPILAQPYAQQVPVLIFYNIIIIIIVIVIEMMMMMMMMMMMIDEVIKD